PTVAALAGLPAPARTDGISLLPALTGRGQMRERGPLYFEYNIAGRTPDYPTFAHGRRNRLRGQMQAIRLGDLMGVRYDVKSARDDFEIYNVVTDPKETTNLAGERAYAATQHFMQAAALRLRRPNPSAPRPYETSLVPALAPAATVAGVEWRAYAGPFPWVPDYETLTPIASGTALRLDPAGVMSAGAPGLCFTGNLLVPADGEYTFYLTADTGAVLRLHGATVIDADFGYAPGTEKTAVIRLQAGLHPFRLSAIHAEGRVPALRLAWSGPGLTHQPVADGALVHTLRSTSVAP
ncbi:MAG TPA: PA14 domain-containing protein, partial [Lacunisphaera sp.]|nr:PA14 domain-containing protein [Lacunisphaera sp.]